MGRLWTLHRKFLQVASQKEVFLKTIICQSTEEGDLKEALALIRDVNMAAVLVLQPNAFENHNQLKDKLDTFRNICLENKVTTCVIPQMHKVLRVR
jgi:organic radical activating enzyme